MQARLQRESIAGAQLEVRKSARQAEVLLQLLLLLLLLLQSRGKVPGKQQTESTHHPKVVTIPTGAPASQPKITKRNLHDGQNNRCPSEKSADPGTRQALA